MANEQGSVESARDSRRGRLPRSFTFRALLTLLTIFTICLAWQTSIYNRQARIIRTIREAGGGVRHRFHDIRIAEATAGGDYISGGGTYKYRFIKKQDPPPKKWYPFDFTGSWDVVYVLLPESGIDSEMIQFLSTMPHLNYVEPVMWSGNRDSYKRKVAEMKAALPDAEFIGIYVGHLEFLEKQRLPIVPDAIVVPEANE